MPAKSTTLLAISIFLLPAPSQAAGRDNVCESVAGAIRNGITDNRDASSAILDPMISGANPGLAGKVVTDDPTLKAIRKFYDEDDRFDVHRLAPGIFAADMVEGTAACQNFRFFRTSNGKMEEIKGPPALSGGPGKLCWRDTAKVGQIGSTPVILEENDLSDNSLALTVMPWSQDGWGPACTVNARFLTAFRFDANYCDGNDCEILGQEALTLAQRYRNVESFRMSGAVADGDEDKVLLAHARDPILNKLPTLGKNRSNLYDNFENKVAVPVTVKGAKLLAVIGGGSLGWRDYPGYLVAFWRLSGGRLEPVAGFNIESFRSAAISATVSGEGAAP